jgi:SAM-dependent methyltransferase
MAMFERVLVPVYLPSWLHRTAVKVKRALVPSKRPPVQLDIRYERHPEWTFISSRMGTGPGNVLDFGCELGYLSLLAAVKGFQVVGLDLQDQNFAWSHPSFRFVREDLFKVGFPKEHFDMVINCSAVEHVGLAGRYGVDENQPDGDLEAMQRLRSLLKPDGIMLMTAPCGRDMVCAPFHRVYGAERLACLFRGYILEEENFWMKDGENRWAPCLKQTALDLQPVVNETDPFKCLYAIGCFALRKCGGAGSEAKPR